MNWKEVGRKDHLLFEVTASYFEGGKGGVAVANALQKKQIIRSVFVMPIHLKAQV
jgi:hypothetical protein